MDTGQQPNRWFDCEVTAEAHQQTPVKLEVMVNTHNHDNSMLTSLQWITNAIEFSHYWR